jgi:transcriptional regulator with XRE-family HTH domain
MLVWVRQIKAARSLIGWGQYQLAVKAGVGIATIRRLERMDGVISAQFGTIEKIRRALEGAGIEFIGAPKPGVCLRLHDVDHNSSGMQ